MNQRQTRALETAQAIKNDDLRTRTIMCILANNIAGLRELRKYAQENDDIAGWEWDILCTLCDMLGHLR